MCVCVCVCVCVCTCAPTPSVPRHSVGGRGLGEAGWGRRAGGGYNPPNILGVSLSFKQNYDFKLLNSDGSLNLRVVC